MVKLLVLLAFTVGASDACSCAFDDATFSLNNAFCSSEFVLASDRNRVQKTFNGTELSPQILTASNTAACGIELKIGEKYLLGGRLDANGSLRSNLCGIVKRWRDVSTSDRQALLTYQCSIFAYSIAQLLRVYEAFRIE